MVNINDITCPCTLLVMFDPVSFEDGSAFEREFIEEYIKTNNLHPLTRQELRNKSLTPNLSLRRVISDHLSNNMHLFEKDDVYFSKRFCNEIRDYILKNDVQSLKNKLATTLDYRYFTRQLTRDNQTAFYLAAEKGSKESTTALFEYLLAKDLLESLPEPPQSWAPKYLINSIDGYLSGATFGDSEKRKVIQLFKFDEFTKKCDHLYAQNLVEKYSNIDLQIVEWLLSSLKIPIRETDKFGNSMIMRAALKSNMTLFQYLLAKGSQTDAEPTLLLNNLSTLNVDIDSYNNQNENCFYVCLFKKNAQMYRLLVDYLLMRVKLHNTQYTALNIEQFRDNPLRMALVFYSNNLGLIEKILNLNGEYLKMEDSNQRTVLFDACESNNVKLVELLVARGADVNHEDKYGRNCLHYAVKYKPNKQVINLLVENHIYMDQLDCECKTPWHLAPDRETKNYLGKIKHHLERTKSEVLEEKVKQLEERLSSYQTMEINIIKEHNSQDEIKLGDEYITNESFDPYLPYHK